MNSFLCIIGILVNFFNCFPSASFIVFVYILIVIIFFQDIVLIMQIIHLLRLLRLLIILAWIWWTITITTILKSRALTFITLNFRYFFVVFRGLFFFILKPVYLLCRQNTDWFILLLAHGFVKFKKPYQNILLAIFTNHCSTSTLV
jgi:hypothetical protein